MENITLSQAWAWLLTIAAGVVSLAKLWDIIKDRMKPQKKLAEEVRRQKELLERDKQHLDEIDNALKEQQRVNAIIFRALFAQINHEISGNGDEILKKSRDELQDYLAGR